MQDAEDEVGWSNTRVAYYWNDIDETGEKELTDFEELFSDRIEAISRIICEKLRKASGTERTSSRTTASSRFPSTSTSTTSIRRITPNR